MYDVGKIKTSKKRLKYKIGKMKNNQKRQRVQSDQICSKIITENHI